MVLVLLAVLGLQVVRVLLDVQLGLVVPWVRVLGSIAVRLVLVFRAVQAILGVLADRQVLRVQVVREVLGHRRERVVLGFPAVRVLQLVLGVRLVQVGLQGI